MRQKLTLVEQLEKTWEEYLESVRVLAKTEFQREIKPWIDRYHLEFRSGMGGWWVYATEDTPDWFVNRYKDTYFNKRFYLDNDKFPEKIQRILNAEINGLPANNLGSLVPDYCGS